MMTKTYVLVAVIWFNSFMAGLGYCPTCEQNNNFMNLMSSIRAGNNNNNNNYMGYGSTSNNGFNNFENYGNSNSWGSQQGGYANNNNGYVNNYGSNGNTFGISSGVPSNGFGSVNTFSTNNNNNNHNFNGIPVRIYTTNGYGCCMNTFGPCCSGTSTFNSFLPNHSSFGGIAQASPSSDVPGSIPHVSYSPSPQATASPVPTYDYSNTVQNNIPFTGPTAVKQADAPATITSATFDFYPQQHVNTNQHSVSPTATAYQSQPQVTSQEPLYYKNPYGSATF